MIPQGRDYNKIHYVIEENKITITINDITDTFDFEGVPDGELEIRDKADGNLLIESELEEIPLRSVKKVDGELYVELLFSMSPSETDRRLLFPNWMTLDEFNDLMEEIKERDKEVETDGEDELENS